MSLGSAIVGWGRFVKLPHTVFALPFALLGVVYASLHARVTLRVVVLVTVAFTGARFAAMGFNRIVDRDIDALNPRTRGRELPAGRLSVGAAGLSVAVASAVFVASAWLLNPLCFYLSPPALAWILGYSYTKRLTHWSHLWLGASLAMAPAGGYLAVTGRWPDPWWTLPLIGLAVLTWVAGFDIFYALQDEQFDREHGLKSAVVRLGQGGAILTAKVMHGLTVGLLFAFGWFAGFGALFYAGVIAAAAILTWEHRLVRPGDLSKVNTAFFTMNGVMSVVVVVFALADRLL
ncbi:MAG: UbiA-like polyprenyltransferase [Gemmatimonadales bacterium]